MSVQIHPTAIVSPKAVLGPGVQVGPFCVIDDRVTIGANTVLRPRVHICSHTTVGEQCRIFENVVLGPEPQDLGFKNEESYVEIGSRTTIRENVTIHRASGEGNVTRVGNDCLIMEGVHLGHNVQVGNRVIISSKSGLAGYVSIGDYTVIGGMAGFHQFLRVGSYCMVGGLSKCIQDVPPFTLIDGQPARIYGLNVVGLRRNGFTSEERRQLRRAYTTIYRSGLPLREAVEVLADQYDNDLLVDQIVAFFRGGDHRRGFCVWPHAQGRHETE